MGKLALYSVAVGRISWTVYSKIYRSVVGFYAGEKWSADNFPLHSNLRKLKTPGIGIVKLNIYAFTHQLSSFCPIYPRKAANHWIVPLICDRWGTWGVTQRCDTWGTEEKPLIGYLFCGYYYYPLTDFERVKRAEKLPNMRFCSFRNTARMVELIPYFKSTTPLEIVPQF